MIEPCSRYTTFETKSARSPHFGEISAALEGPVRATLFLEGYMVWVAPIATRAQSAADSVPAASPETVAIRG
jgi:hypothetical protein